MQRMRKAVGCCLVLAVLTACGGGGDTPSGDGASGGAGGGGGSTSGAVAQPAAYDPALVPVATAPLPNNISGGGFEGSEWALCGAATLEASDSPSGGQALKLDPNGDCPTRFNYAAAALASLPLSGQPWPEEAHISLWIKASANLPTDQRIQVRLELSSSDNVDAIASYSRSLPDAELIDTGWNRLVFTVKREDVVFLGGGSAPTWLRLSTNRFAGVTFWIDDLKITSAPDTPTQAQPMPQALLDDNSDDRLVFLDQSANQLSVMRVNGRDRVNFPELSLDLLRSTPSWMSADSIGLSYATYSPLPALLPVEAAEGSVLRRMPAGGGAAQDFYSTTGQPGNFEGPGSLNNRDTINIGVRTSAWSAARNMGALTICGFTSLNQSRSDDVCRIQIVDPSTGRDLGEGVTGFNPTWSADGRLLAYVEGERSLQVAQVDDAGNINAVRTVYQSPTGMAQVVAWSPDGRSLAMLESGSGFVSVGEELGFVRLLTIVDANTGAKRRVTRIDHGITRNSLTWLRGGRYLAYSVTLPDGRQQIWWADAQTGATGPITNTLNAAYPQSRGAS